MEKGTELSKLLKIDNEAVHENMDRGMNLMTFMLALVAMGMLGIMISNNAGS